MAPRPWCSISINFFSLIRPTLQNIPPTLRLTPANVGGRRAFSSDQFRNRNIIETAPMYCRVNDTLSYIEEVAARRTGSLQSGSNVSLNCTSTKNPRRPYIILTSCCSSPGRPSSVSCIWVLLGVLCLNRLGNLIIHGVLGRRHRAPIGSVVLVDLQHCVDDTEMDD